MPAMMMSEMPLPMPYSSICSPSHIRKTVPTVIVRTAANPNQHQVEAVGVAGRHDPDPAVRLRAASAGCTTISAWIMQIGTVR